MLVSFSLFTFRSGSGKSYVNIIIMYSWESGANFGTSAANFLLRYTQKYCLLKGRGI